MVLAMKAYYSPTVPFTAGIETISSERGNACGRGVKGNAV